MNISEKDVRYVAELASLELTGDERTRMVKDLGAIIDYIGRLNELDTTGVAPMAQVPGMFNPLHRGDDNGNEDAVAPMRDDRALTSLDRATVLKNAPQEANGFFKVPRVLPSGDQ